MKLLLVCLWLLVFAYENNLSADELNVRYRPRGWNLQHRYSPTLPTQLRLQLPSQYNYQASRYRGKTVYRETYSAPVAPTPQP